MARRAKFPRIDVMPSKDANDEVRIRWLKQDYWLPHKSAEQILKKLQELLDDPAVIRMPNLAIVGKPFIGKTALLKKFASDNNPQIDPTSVSTDIPVLIIDAPPTPSESRLYSALLVKLGMTGPTREPVDKKLPRLHACLEDLNVRMIILDEFNRSIRYRGGAQDSLMSAIRDIGNALEINFVLAGTESMLGLLVGDDQSSSRFPSMFMKTWNVDKESAEMLLEIGKLLPLQGKVNIHGDKAVTNIVTFSEGILGEMIDIVRRLAIDAITDKSESITFTKITRKNLRRLGYIQPSRRSNREEILSE